MSKDSAMAALTATIPTTPTTTVTEGAAGVLTAPPATTEAPKELDSTRITHLMKKEADLVKQREAFKKESELLQSEKTKLREVQEKLTHFEELRGKDPVAALKLMGFSETDLLNYLTAAEDKATPEERASKAAQNEIQKFKDEQAKLEAERNEKRNTEVIKNFKTDINKFITKDKDAYEFINHYGSIGEELIYDTVEEVLKDSGELITIKEAADLVEQYYEDSFKAMNGLKKVAPKAPVVEAAPTPAPAPSPTKEIPNVVSKPMPAKTLTAKTTATLASTQLYKRESIGEKKARLAQKLANLGKD